eukprot:scaffold1495_cov362-Pavlova_lutheri.AAC.1
MVVASTCVWWRCRGRRDGWAERQGTFVVFLFPSAAIGITYIHHWVIYPWLSHVVIRRGSKSPAPGRLVGDDRRMGEWRGNSKRVWASIAKSGCIGEKGPLGHFPRGRGKHLVEIHSFTLLEATHAQAGFVALYPTVAIGLYLEHPRGGQGGASRRKGDQVPGGVLGQRGEFVVWRLRAHLLFPWPEDDEGGGVGVRSRSFARAFVSPRCSRPLGGTLRN